MKMDTTHSSGVHAGLPASPDVTSPVLTVEWEMMDKRKYYPLSMMSHFSVRCLLYPLAVIRTRLQVQLHHDNYEGTVDAFRKIVRYEGVRGLYQGFWVSAIQVVSGVSYVSTYEGIRHLLERHNITNNSTVKSFCGGLCASLVGQTINVPFDVISQHMMVLGQSRQPGGKGPNPLGIVLTRGNDTKARIVGEIVRQVYKRDGLKGFYRGYLASLGTYAPSSASWWAFYDIFQNVYGQFVPEETAHMALQCISAMSAGAASTVLTNPLDLIRARVQVQRTSIPDTLRILWETEKMNLFCKGLTARMAASVIYSVAIIFGYETVKRWSVYDEYKTRVKW